MIKSFKAVDFYFLFAAGKRIDFQRKLRWTGPEALKKYCQPVNFRLITTKQSFGPFGSSDTTGRVKMEIPIESADITSQVTNHFVYLDYSLQFQIFTNQKCFTFHVSLNYQSTRIIIFFSLKSNVTSCVGQNRKILPKMKLLSMTFT